MPLHLIHLSDTHLGPSADYEVRGVRTQPVVEQLVEAVNTLDFTPDLIVHTGDVTDYPTAEAYQVAAKCFGQLKAPCAYITGNHDYAHLIREHLTFPPGTVFLTEEPNRVFYRIDLPGLRVYGLDARLENDEEPCGELPESQLDLLETDALAHEGPVALFVHFPPLPLHTPWMDRYLLMKNGESFHARLSKWPGGKLRGVFFGHVHRGVQLFRDGVFYSGVASSVCQFTTPATEEKIEFLTDVPLVFNHLIISDSGVVVKEQIAPRRPLA